MSELKSKSIALIVEDDPDLIHIFAQALELSGFQTHTVTNGEDAIKMLTDIEPNIVVLDLHLPGISGSEILQTIRSNNRLNNTCVILATADHRTAEDLRDLADLVLLKPISFKQLRDLSARFNQLKKAASSP